VIALYSKPSLHLGEGESAQQKIQTSYGVISQHVRNAEFTSTILYRPSTGRSGVS
jgi:hypothetical protein